jgi:hypothetical protein
MCKASNCTIVEVEELLEVGEIPPEQVRRVINEKLHFIFFSPPNASPHLIQIQKQFQQIHVPSIYCHRLIVGGKNYKKPFEKLILREDNENPNKETTDDPGNRIREIIARRAALEFQDGMYG